MKLFCQRISKNQDQTRQLKNAQNSFGAFLITLYPFTLSELFCRPITMPWNFRRKYELQQFLDINPCVMKYTSTGLSLRGESSQPNSNNDSVQDKKNSEKHQTRVRQGLSQAFRNSWRRKEPEQKSAKKFSTVRLIWC